jgi:hypothetical protein
MALRQILKSLDFVGIHLIETDSDAGTRSRIGHRDTVLRRHLNIKDRADVCGCRAREQRSARCGTGVIKNTERYGASNGDNDPAHTAWRCFEYDRASAGCNSLAESAAIRGESLADESGYHEISCNYPK